MLQPCKISYNWTRSCTTSLKFSLNSLEDSSHEYSKGFRVRIVQNILRQATPASWLLLIAKGNAWLHIWRGQLFSSYLYLFWRRVMSLLVTDLSTNRPISPNSTIVYKCLQVIVLFVAVRERREGYDTTFWKNFSFHVRAELYRFVCQKNIPSF